MKQHSTAKITFISAILHIVLIPVIFIIAGQIINYPRSIQVGKGSRGNFTCFYWDHYNKCDFSEFVKKEKSWLPFNLFISSPFILAGTLITYLEAKRRINRKSNLQT